MPLRVQQGLTEAVDRGEGGRISNGWRVPPMSLGDYGTQYAVRAAVAREGLGANLPEDAVYASTRVDVDEQPLTGERRYVIDMPADVPVRGFWSITAYDDGGNLLAGSTEALSVSGDADSGPQRIIVSAQRPAEQDVAWLRSPTSGGLRLIMRLYWPEQSVLDGQWSFPAVRPE